MIAQNIEQLKRRVAEACARVGRDAEDVRIVAVSKTFGVELIKKAFEAGLVDFGENYVQELREKMERLSGKPVRWHFIGHLQTNKVKYIINSVRLIHTLDSVRLAEELQKRATGPVDVLVEVHTTDEATKTGVDPRDVVPLVREVVRLQNVRICGLMTMGPFSDTPEDSRPSFRMLRELRAKVESENIPNVRMQHLSMGMTHDFEVAVEEGATILRIGTAIFGGRKARENSKS
ncbi:MAG: YggS family pyridoxal phosphate-dependent enzyme [Ignavibacteriales bacterium]|nr:YggS family pyridoxal phosphate-dependent enzyme [Ignavibacteriales bacterium]